MSFLSLYSQTSPLFQGWTSRVFVHLHIEWAWRQDSILKLAVIHYGDSSRRGHRLALGSLHDRGCSEWHRRCRRSVGNLAVSTPARAVRFLSMTVTGWADMRAGIQPEIIVPSLARLIVGMTKSDRVRSSSGRRIKRRSTLRWTCFRASTAVAERWISSRSSLSKVRVQRRWTRGLRDRTIPAISASSSSNSSAMSGTVACWKDHGVKLGFPSPGLKIRNSRLRCSRMQSSEPQCGQVWCLLWCRMCGIVVVTLVGVGKVDGCNSDRKCLSNLHHEYEQ